MPVLWLNICELNYFCIFVKPRTVNENFPTQTVDWEMLFKFTIIILIFLQERFYFLYMYQFFNINLLKHCVI